VLQRNTGKYYFQVFPQKACSLVYTAIYLLSKQMVWTNVDWQKPAEVLRFLWFLCKKTFSAKIYATKKIKIQNLNENKRCIAGS
jgi:hypothetical protein